MSTKLELCQEKSNAEKNQKNLGFKLGAEVLKVFPLGFLSGFDREEKVNKHPLEHVLIELVDYTVKGEKD